MKKGLILCAAMATLLCSCSANKASEAPVSENKVNNLIKEDEGEYVTLEQINETYPLVRKGNYLMYSNMGVFTNTCFAAKEDKTEEVIKKFANVKFKETEYPKWDAHYPKEKKGYRVYVESEYFDKKANLTFRYYLLGIWPDNTVFFESYSRDGNSYGKERYYEGISDLTYDEVRDYFDKTFKMSF